jgi:hypothetical protein
MRQEVLELKHADKIKETNATRQGLGTGFTVVEGAMVMNIVQACI